MKKHVCRGWMGILLLTLWCSGACVSSPVLHPEAAAGSCAAPIATPVAWLRAVAASERTESDRWCSALGAPVVASATASGSALTAPIAVVSWNTHVGGADISALVSDLRSGRVTGTPTGQLILLLQEVYRSDASIPASVTGARFASAQTPAPPDGRRHDIVATARELGLSLFYAPSMRNGAIREDRGSAVLASGTLHELEAIELPLERQRRVSVAASIRVGGANGFDLHVVSAHFTNFVAHHLWALSEPGRVRQARVLARLLRADDRPTVLGGDLNSWFGYNDAAYRKLARALAAPQPSDRRPTFGPMRLDHLLYRLPAGWRMTTRRAPSRYGSDHYPLVGILEAPPPG